ETLAMIGMGMMKSSADIHADAGLQRAFGRQDRATSGQPERLYKFGRVGELHLQLFLLTDLPMEQTIYVTSSVHQPDIVIGGGGWCDKVICIRLSRGAQAVVNHPIFLRREDVRADWQEVLIAVNERKRQAHGTVAKVDYFTSKEADIGWLGMARNLSSNPG